MNRAFVGISEVSGRDGTRGAHAANDSRSSTGGCNVYVEQNGLRYRLTRRVRRKREGYRWDGVGPDSTELARAILWIVTGEEPPWSLYRGFVSDVVAHFPAPAGCDGTCWRLREEEVTKWMRDVGWISSEQREHDKNRSRAAQQGSGPRVMRTRQERIRGLPIAFWKRGAT